MTSDVRGDLPVKGDCSLRGVPISIKLHELRGGKTYFFIHSLKRRKEKGRGVMIGGSCGTSFLWDSLKGEIENTLRTLFEK